MWRQVLTADLSFCVEIAKKRIWFLQKPLSVVTLDFAQALSIALITLCKDIKGLRHICNPE